MLHFEFWGEIPDMWDIGAYEIGPGLIARKWAKRRLNKPLALR